MFKSKVFKNTMASVAQIATVVILLPIVLVIIEAIAPDAAKTFIINSLDEIPVIRIFSNYFISVGETQNVSAFALLEYIIDTISASLVSMYIVGLFGFITKILGELIGMRGVPAIQTVVGIFLSSFCLKFLGGDLEKSIYCTVALLMAALVLSVVVQKAGLKTFFWKAGLEIAMATITSGTLCGYCAVLVLFMRGYFGGLLSGINVIIWSLIPAMICLLIDYLLFSEKD